MPGSFEIERHFTATGIVLNEKEQTLLIRHRKLGVWLPPGGHVEENETPDAAVLREVWEECGLRAQILPNCEKEQASDQWAQVLHTPYAILLEDIGQKGTHFHIDLVYRCLANQQTARANTRETNGFRWFSMAEINALGNDEIYHNARVLVLCALQEGFAPGNDL